MEKLLVNKVIVVSGGTKGVGREVVTESVKEGADVVIGGRDQAAADKIIQEVIDNNYGKTPYFVKTQVTQVEGCKKLIDDSIAKYGRIDGYVNYAGILPEGYLYETEEELFDKVITLNIKAAFFCAKYVVKHMLETGGGSMVFVGSAHGYGGEKDRAAYAVSKGALLTLYKHIAKNYAEDNIRSNYVVMGWVATPGELAFRETQNRDLKWLETEGVKYIPMGRMMTVEDHAPGIVYLLSDKASAVTGTELNITGGFTA
ncbi:MAG: SDR family oxidoreductase [Clostridia bacterium]|jgi:NAD(P)-dependent dehydrogenase (short-subunit alcohol dehydrogenase family)|nr:SDR family oxidoreductase [Clostridia bacterium]